MDINTRLLRWATLHRTPDHPAALGRSTPPGMSREWRFQAPLHERIGLLLLDTVIMAVCVGGLAFTGFIGYMALR